MLVVAVSCTSEQPEYTKQKGPETVQPFEPVPLPDDLNTIINADLAPILPMLGDAQLIGMSEGTHGFTEPFMFRNALIKCLVEEGRISVVAIESGIIETKLAYDYVIGADIPLDTVLANISCTFGKFEKNRELLQWLRAWNSDKPEDEQVHFYGFDIPGCAPNPVLEDATISFRYWMDYLKEKDPQLSFSYEDKLSLIYPLIRMKDSANDDQPGFESISDEGWKSIFLMVESMSDGLLNQPAELEEFEWAAMAYQQSLFNLHFLHSIGNPKYEYAPRERGMAFNVNWIMSREEGESILLFADLGHLAGEIHMHNEGAMVTPMAGEYMKEAWGHDYKVIGNFYGKLDWFDGDPLLLEEGTIDFELSKKGIANFYIELDKNDTTWQREWAFGKPSSGGQVYMVPSQSIDIILYNDVQHWFEGADQ